MGESHDYCDVSLPVPLDRPFTYRLPETLRHRVKAGCRVIVPFGPRKMTGVVVKVHNHEPPVATREALRLLDAEPVFDAAMLKLARWVADYYCAPLGEVLRTMAPLAGEMRRTKVWALTEKGRDVARRLLVGDSGEEPTVELLRLLEQRAMSETSLARKFKDLKKALAALERKSLIEVEQSFADRDPLRAPAARLRVEFRGRPQGVKLTKAERELVAFLELHPGTHNLQELDAQVKGAAAAARAMARRKLMELKPEALEIGAGWSRPPHDLNERQQAAFDAVRSALEARRFQVFLLQGVTGSGKTEVYLNCIEAALALGRGALLMVPEIALTPAVAGQFHTRFGDQVAILHSAFHDAERAEQWRRLRSGTAQRGGRHPLAVFAPVADLGLIIVDEEHDNSYKQEETPRYHGRDIAIVRAQALNAAVVLGSATPSLESRYNVDRGKSELILLPQRIGNRPCPTSKSSICARSSWRPGKNALFSRRSSNRPRQVEAGEQTILLHEPPRLLQLVACRSCGERVQCVNCAVALTYHRRDNRLLCHYCNYASACRRSARKCGSDHIYFLGSGWKKWKTNCTATFPKARIARLDRDTVTGKHHYEPS